MREVSSAPKLAENWTLIFPGFNRRATIVAQQCAAYQDHQPSSHHQQSQLSAIAKKIEKWKAISHIGVSTRDNDQRDALNLPFDSVEPDLKIWVIKLYGNNMNLNSCHTTTCGLNSIAIILLVQIYLQCNYIENISETQIYRYVSLGYMIFMWFFCCFFFCFFGFLVKTDMSGWNGGNNGKTSAEEVLEILLNGNEVEARTLYIKQNFCSKGSILHIFCLCIRKCIFVLFSTVTRCFILSKEELNFFFFMFLLLTNIPK